MSRMRVSLDNMADPQPALFSTPARWTRPQRNRLYGFPLSVDGAGRGILLLLILRKRLIASVDSTVCYLEDSAMSISRFFQALRSTTL